MTRVISSLVLVGGATAAIVWLPNGAFLWLVFFLMLLGLREFGKLMLTEKSDRVILLLLGSFLFLAVALDFFLLLSLVAALFATVLWGMFRHHRAPQETAGRIAMLFTGICYLGLTLPFWVRLHEINFRLVFVAALPVVFCDTFGYLFGTRFGKRKLAPVLSPNKTWEGFAASLGGVLLAFWGMSLLLFENPRWGFWSGTLTAIGIGLVAVLGDLSVSFFKRTVGAKDSGTLIPGHGGMLDRLDAMIFTAPFFYGVFLAMSLGS